MNDGKRSDGADQDQHDDQHLFLRVFGLSMMGNSRDQQLGFEGAAEHYWSMLIAPLQH